MRRVRIITNEYESSKNFKKEILDFIKNEKLDLDVVEDETADVIIVIGGDGAFLRACKITKFNTNMLYVGINSGTIGFLQDVDENNIKDILIALNSNLESYRDIPVLRITFYYENHEEIYKAINDIEIAGMYDKLIDFRQFVNGELLHDVRASGIIISSSIGSTALNKSYGGPVLFIDKAIVSTLRGATCNLKNKSYLNQSIVCESTTIEFPDIAKQRLRNKNFNRFRNEVYFSIDGQTLTKVDTNSLRFIDVRIDCESLKILKINDNYDTRIKKVRNKLL